MAHPKYTLAKDVSVGIYDNCEVIARVYSDKIVTISPYVKWVGNTGGYAEKRVTIRDVAIVQAVLADMGDNSVDSAWEKIDIDLSGRY